MTCRYYITRRWSSPLGRTRWTFSALSVRQTRPKIYDRVDGPWLMGRCLREMGGVQVNCREASGREEIEPLIRRRRRGRVKTCSLQQHSHCFDLYTNLTRTEWFVSIYYVIFKNSLDSNRFIFKLNYWHITRQISSVTLPNSSNLIMRFMLWKKKKRNVEFHIFCTVGLAFFFLLLLLLFFP